MPQHQNPCSLDTCKQYNFTKVVSIHEITTGKQLKISKLIVLKMVCTYLRL